MTMNRPTNLTELLPQFYTVRDIERGGPLRALLAVIAEQVDVVRRDIEDLYDDWFIETCRDWVVPYIGELIGYEPGSEAVVSGDIGSREWQLRSRVLVPRRDVARTIAHRRRKGTLALLEGLGTDAADWPTRAVEHHPLVMVTQNVNHLRPERGRTVDLRDRDLIDRIGGAFDEAAHLVAAGRIGSRRTLRRHNIPNVGLFAWRLQPFSHTEAPARNIDRAKNRFTFDLLGVDQPLVTKPISEPDASHIADERNVPAFIRRLALDVDTADLYGEGRSLCVFRVGPGNTEPPKLEPFPDTAVVTADLTGWQYRPRRGQLVIDPVLGRIAMHPREPLSRGIWVSYHHAAPAAIGGGEYPRSLGPVTDRTLYAVRHGQSHVKADDPYPSISDAYRAWQADLTAADPKQWDKVRDAVIEITDNEEYVEAPRIALHRGERLEIRAAQGHSPLIRLLDLHANRSDSWEFEGIAPTPEPGATASGTVAHAVGAAPTLSTDSDEADDDDNDTGTWDGTADTPPASPEGGAQVDDGSSEPHGKPEGSTGTQDGTSRGGSTKPGGTSDKTSGRGAKKPGKQLVTTGGCGDPTHDCGDCRSARQRPALDSLPRLVLDGLIIAGRSVRVSGEIGLIVIRHTTMVPGWWLDADCCPTDEEEPSLEVDDLCGRVVIEHSILGTIVVGRDEVAEEPMPISISDSVLDATRPDVDALATRDGRHAHVSLTIRRSTVLGRMRVHRMELGEDSIFADHLSVRRRQVGCVRFSYVPLDARTPRRHACQPDLAKARIRESFERKELTAEDRDEELALVELRVRPRFDSRRYRTPAYVRLSELCPIEIAAGASDGSEMGVYHDLFQPIREANLRTRLDESIPAGSDAAIVYAT